MANKRINDLVDAPVPAGTDRVVIDGATTRSATLDSIFDSVGPKRIWTPSDFNAVGDAVSVVGAVTITGGTNVLVVGASFVIGNIGKAIIITGAGTAGIPHSSTIAGVVDAQNIVIAAAAGTALVASSQRVVYGTDDTLKILDVVAAIQAGTVRNFAHPPDATGYLILPTDASRASHPSVFALSSVIGLRYDFNGVPIYVGYPSVTGSANIFQFTNCRDCEIQGVYGVAMSGKSTAGSTGVNWAVITQSHQIRIIEGNIVGGRSYSDLNRTLVTGTFSSDCTVTGNLTNCFYGVANESGCNGLKVGLVTDNAGRSLIDYGHFGLTEFFIRSKNPTDNDILINAYGHNTDSYIIRTANVRGVYVNKESTTSFGQIFLSHQQADAAIDSIVTTIENVHIHLDIDFLITGVNQYAIGNNSWIGHSGTATLGDAGHIERNIVFTGRIGGKVTSDPIIRHNDSALGWGTNSNCHWTLKDLAIPDADAHPILIGPGARTQYLNVRAPSLARPTFDGSPIVWDHVWQDCLFVDAGNYGTRPYGSPRRIKNPTSQVAGSDGWMFDYGVAALWSDGTNTISLIHCDISKFYYTVNSTFSHVWRTDGGTERWQMITGGHYKPVTDNAVDIGDATHRARFIYGVTGAFTTVNHGASGTLGSAVFGNATSGTITVQPVAGALGSVTLSLPAATDTLVGKATTDTLTNKTVNLTSNTLSGTTAQFNTALSDNDFATLAGAEELTNKTLNASVGKGVWTASGTWTIPAVTLGGTVSGGGNQLNNVIIGTSTPLAGSFTTLSATGALTYGGVTLTASVSGTGKMVLDTNPTITKPNIVGTVTNDNASAGSEGEYMSANVAIGAESALTTGTGLSLCNIVLTAGDWDVDGIVYFQPGATTNITNLIGSISTTNNTLDTTVGRFNQRFESGSFVPGAGGRQTVCLVTNRFSVAGSTTVYLVALSNFTVSTNAASGIIRARRVR